MSERKDTYSVTMLAAAKVAVYAIVVILLYYSALEQLITKDWARDEYSHCFFIPLIFLYSVWERRNAFSSKPLETSWSGLALVMGAIGLFWIGELGSEKFLVYASLWAIVVGLTLHHNGWRRLKTIAFPLIFLLAMFPLPDFINARLTFALKLLSSHLGVTLLNAYGMSAYREGNVIDLGFTQLQVVDACSGLNYVIPLFLLSLLLASYFRAHLWKRIVLVVSSVPLAILVNSFRIAITGVLYGVFGAKVAEDFFHGFAGWLIFVSLVPVLLAEMWLLRRLPPSDSRAVHGQRRAADESPPRTPQHVEPARKEFFAQKQFIAAVILLSLTLATYHSIDIRQRIPIKNPLHAFPMTIGAWEGSPQVMEEKFADMLKFSDYLLADYTGPYGGRVSLYVAYYEEQRKEEYIHSPDVCLPAGGWQPEESGVTRIDLPEKGLSLAVNRAVLERSGTRMLTYYWFPQRGRNLTTFAELKLYKLWDSVTLRRTDGALVRLTTSVLPGEAIEDTEIRLRAFTREVVPVLHSFLPGRELTS